MGYLKLLVLLIVFASCHAENEKTERTPGADSTGGLRDSIDEKISTWPEITPELAVFIPEGYRIRQLFENDMNLDSLDDVTLILEIDTDLDSGILTRLFGIADRQELSITRDFLILLRQKDGTLKQAAKSEYLFSGRTARFLILSVYFPELEIEDGRFGYSNFFFHNNEGHYEESLRFEYSKKHRDWLLMEIDRYYTSDTPTEEGGYDNHEGSFHKKEKDLGVVGINAYDTTSFQ